MEAQLRARYLEICCAQVVREKSDHTLQHESFDTHCTAMDSGSGHAIMFIEGGGTSATWKETDCWCHGARPLRKRTRIGEPVQKRRSKRSERLADHGLRKYHNECMFDGWRGRAARTKRTVLITTALAATASAGDASDTCKRSL